jgi:hypothetical protein
MVTVMGHPTAIVEGGMTTRTRLAVAAVACAAALTVGTAVAAASPPVAGARAPQGYVTTRVKAAGLSLALPRAWLRLDPKSKTWEKVLQRVAAKNPRLQSTLSQFPALRNSIVYWSIDTGATTFASNVLILPLPFDDSVVDHPDEAQSALQSGTGSALQNLEVTKTKVAGGKALRVTYTAPIKNLSGQTTTAVGTAFMIPTKKGMMHVEYTSDTPSDQDRTLSTIEKSIRLL